MAASLSEFALDLIWGLVKHAVEKVVDFSVLDYFKQRKVYRRVEDAVADVVEPLLPFLKQENISEEKQRRLLQTCVDELRPLSAGPEQLFQGSLNGQKIFDNLYTKHPLPEVVIEDGVKEVYLLLCPRVAELLCKVPAAIKEWETLAWAENYRRLDDLVRELRALFSLVDEIKNMPNKQADETLGRVRRSLVQKIGLEMDITGLRGDQPLSGKLSEFFEHPAIKEIINEKDKKPKIVENTADDFKQFVNANKKNIVIGVGGAGKSTWTKWLQRETLNSNEIGFGVRVELRNFTGNSLPSLYELVRETAGKHFAEELTSEVISRWLDNKFLVLILDGFDEIASIERDVVYDWIADLCQAARGCPVVLTSRPITTNHLNRMDVFHIRWTIEPFDLARIIEYIQHWYEHAPLLTDFDRNVDATALANEWQSDPTLAPLTGNPLLLSTLLMVHHLDGHLPSGRSRLYQRYIDGMLGLWDDRRKVINPTIALSLAQKKQIIRGLALYMFIQERDQLEETIVLEWLQVFLKTKGISQSGDDVLCMLRERSGLIIGPGVYNFAHKSIAEYLVAEIVWDGDQKDLAGQSIDRMYLFGQRDNDRWNSVIFLWAGLASLVDLITFINSCLDVENWALAYGILYDQYDRISDHETRHSLLILDRRKDQAHISFEITNHYIVFGLDGSPSSTKIKYAIPSIKLRGIVESINYDDLINLAIETGDLTFEDRLFSRLEELVHLIWFGYFKKIMENVDGLKEYNRMRSPLCKSDEEWSIYILHRLLSSALYSGKEIGQTVELCHTILPKYDGLVPLLLLSICTEIPEINIPGIIQNKKIIDQIQKILEVLPECSREKSYPNWMLETKDWSYEWSEKQNVDLFVVFNETMEKLVQNGVLPRDVVFDRALTYVDKLHEQRTILAVQMGIDLDAGPQNIEPKQSKQRLRHRMSKNNPE